MCCTTLMGDTLPRALKEITTGGKMSLHSALHLHPETARKAINPRFDSHASNL